MAQQVTRAASADMAANMPAKRMCHCTLSGQVEDITKGACELCDKGPLTETLVTRLDRIDANLRVYGALDSDDMEWMSRTLRKWNEAAIPLPQKIIDAKPIIESFHINEVGSTHNIVVDGSNRFVKEEDLKKVLDWVKEVVTTYPYKFNIIEASETPDGRHALTLQWHDGSETLEIVSAEIARALGYTYPDLVPDEDSPGYPYP